MPLRKAYGQVVEALHGMITAVCVQVVEDAKVRLRGEILSRLQKAKKQGDHSTVLRFTKLYAPLGLQVPCWLLAGCLHSLFDIDVAHGEATSGVKASLYAVTGGGTAVIHRIPQRPRAEESR